MRVLFAVLGMLAIFFSSACSEVESWFVPETPAQETIDPQLKEQITADSAFDELTGQDYQPVEVRTWEEDDPQILFVHCDDVCDEAPYRRDFPAVVVDVAKLPAANESADITAVTIVTRRHAPGDERMTERFCTEPLSSLPSVEDLRAVISELVDDRGSIGAGERVTAADGTESWKCDYR